MQNIRVLDCPAQSRDGIPIEHDWDMLQRRFFKSQDHFQNSAQLFQALRQYWIAISQEDPNPEHRKTL